jgi:hypothetical protein
LKQNLESSTPEKLKSSFRINFQGNNKKVFSKSTSISPPHNRPSSNRIPHANVMVKLLKGTSGIERTFFNGINNEHDGRNFEQKNSILIHSKPKISFSSKSSDSLVTKVNQEPTSTQDIKSNLEDDDAYMSFNNSTCSNSNVKKRQQQQLFKSNSNNILKSNNHVNILNNQKQIISNSMAISCNDLLAKKHELDSSYMDQSILMNKMSPSKSLFLRRCIFFFKMYKLIF